MVWKLFMVADLLASCVGSSSRNEQLGQVTAIYAILVAMRACRMAGSTSVGSCCIEPSAEYILGRQLQLKGVVRAAGLVLLLSAELGGVVTVGAGLVLVLSDDLVVFEFEDRAGTCSGKGGSRTAGVMNKTGSMLVAGQGCACSVPCESKLTSPKLL